MNRLEDLREWLTAKIDGSEETRGEDSLISHFINQIDALPSSEMGTIPSDPAATPVTDAVVKMMEAGWLSLGSSAPGAVKPLVEALEVFERENADLKQRLLPQYLGRAERAEKARQMAEHERDSVVEELIALRSAPSATAAPVAWLIKYDAAPNTGQMQQITHGHNAIGDYRQIDPAATSTPLYSSPQSLPVEVAAIPVPTGCGAIFKAPEGWSCDCERAHPVPCKANASPTTKEQP